MPVIKFEAKWCQPCKQLQKVIDDSGVSIDEIVDIDEHPLRARQYKIRSVPTILVVDDEERELKRLVGNITKEVLQRELT